MKIVKQRITPEKARKYIANQVNNRKVKNRRVSQYAKSMRDGKWKVDTGEPIKFNKDGQLFDGQHRLQALIDANIELDFWVALDCPNDAFQYVDQGAVRTPADMLSTMGVANRQAIAAAIIRYLSLRKSVQTDVTNRVASGITNEDIVKAYQIDPNFWQELYSLSTFWYNEIGYALSKADIAGLYAFMIDIDKDETHKFFSMLCTGDGIPSKNHPIQLLRERLYMLYHQTGVKVKYSYKKAIIFKTWNMYRNNQKTVKEINYDARVEDFPQPI